MIFTPDQVEELIRVIRFNHLLFGIDIAGIDNISNEDMNILNAYGVDPSIVLEDLPISEQAFQFGRLAAALGNYNTKTVKYADFLKFVRNGGHRPLTDAEKETLAVIKRQSFTAVKNLGGKIVSDTTQIIGKSEAERKSKYEKILRGVLKEGVANRQSVQEMVSNLGKKTDDWNRDLGRLVETESHNAYEEGRMAEFQNKYGDDVEVYKDVYENACKSCIKAYLTNGVGSAPIIFKASVLVSNGTNVGRKSADYKPVMHGMHPFCRCTTQLFKKGYVWDSAKKSFVPPSGYTKRYDYNIIVTVGDTTYHI